MSENSIHTTAADSFTRGASRANSDLLREIAAGLTGTGAFPPTIYWYRAAASYLQQLASELETTAHNGVDWGRIRASIALRADAEHSDELERRRA